MSATNAFETALLEHYFQNAAIANVGDAAGLPASVGAGSVYISLHTADPGEAGDQTTSEATYTGYARKAVARSGAGWAVTGNTADNAAAVTFASCTGGTNTITHFGIGSAATGVGNLRFYGALTSSLAVSSGITPSFAIGTLDVSVN